MSDSPLPPEPGALVPGYVIGDPIGKGGFATVYRATQVSLDREVAIKIDQRVLDDPRNRRRFLREATASALISSHPHVVSLIDAGTTRDNRPYLVMELCDNGSVAQLVKRSGPMGPADVVELGIAVSGALAAAHEKGILHRDIKPSNILIDPYGTPRLGDFGLAALPAEGESSVTLEALTPAYAAPEAFEQLEPTKRADVWAMGATLYSVLTGVAPRHGEDGSPMTVAEIISKLYQPLPMPRVSGADPLLKVIWRATSPNREHRFADGGELHAALLELRGAFGRSNPALHGADITRLVPSQERSFATATPQPSSARPKPIALDAQSTRARRSWPIVLSAVLAVGLLGAGGVWAMNTLGQTPSANQPQDVGESKSTPSSPSTTAAAEVPSPSPEEAESPPDPGGPVVPDPPICFPGLVSISGFVTSRQVDCSTEHVWEAYSIGSLSETTPSSNLDDVLEDPAVQQACADELLAEFTGRAADEFEREVVPPSAADFNSGSRLFYCVASDGTSSESFAQR